MRALGVAIAVLCALVLSDASRAQSTSSAHYPERPVRILVGFTAGSSTDITARVFAQKFSEFWHVAVTVENVPGIGGGAALDRVAKAEPDGYTLLFTIQGPLVTAPLLSKALPYDPARELAPVTLVATSPNLLVIDPKLGADTLADFVRIAKAQRGALNYGSVGNGSAAHLAMELFKSRAGIDLVHVPYQGFPQVVNAILAGQVQAGFMVPGIAMGQVRAGKLRGLAVSTLGRSSVLPEFATLAEQGYPGFEAISWQAVLAPAKTPAAIVERVSRELVRIVRSDELRAKMLAQYFSAAGTAPAALANLMASERERWAKVIAAAGVQPE